VSQFAWDEHRQVWLAELGGRVRRSAALRWDRVEHAFYLSISDPGAAGERLARNWEAGVPLLAVLMVLHPDEHARAVDVVRETYDDLRGMEVLDNLRVLADTVEQGGAHLTRAREAAEDVLRAVIPLEHVGRDVACADAFIDPPPRSAPVQ